jgi:Leucine-rich repeat (LRR) protein
VLDLADILATDLGPLAGLTGLQALVLSRTRVADLGPLAGLFELQALDVSGTRVTDLASLRQSDLRVLHSVPTAALKLPPGAASWRLSIESPVP